MKKDVQGELILGKQFMISESYKNKVVVRRDEIMKKRSKNFVQNCTLNLRPHSQESLSVNDSTLIEVKTNEVVSDLKVSKRRKIPGEKNSLVNICKRCRNDCS